MSQRKSHHGETRGRLTFVADESDHGDKRMARFRCTCGTEKVIRLERWTGGYVESCGCFRREQIIKRSTTHGYSGSGMHASWKSMKARTRPGGSYQRMYPTYRGVTYDPRWETFEGFLTDPPRGAWFPGAHLARDGDTGPYAPENCRWASAAENNEEMYARRFPKGLDILTGKAHT